MRTATSPLLVVFVFVFGCTGNVGGSDAGTGGGSSTGGGSNLGFNGGTFLDAGAVDAYP